MGQRTTLGGFTMVELLVTIAVVGIGLALAVPAFNQFIDTNRYQALSRALVADMTNARAEAIRRGVPVGVCASTDGSSCSNTASNWSVGWLVFADLDGSGAPSSSEILSVHNPGGAAVASSTVAGFRFAPSGEARGATASGTRLTTTLQIQFRSQTTTASSTVQVAPYGLISGN